ncbi:MAG: ABC transporter ATP-binding protein [Chloroflexota bacterium]
MLEKLRSAPRFVQSVGHMLRLVWSASPLACVGTLIITALQGLLPLATAWVIKLLLDGLTQRLAQNDAMLDGFLIGLLFLQAAIMLATALLPQVSRYLNAELSRQLTVLIQSTIYTKINRFEGIAYFENPQVYDKIRLAQQGAEQSSQQTLHITTQFIQSAITLLSFVGVLFVFNIFLAGLVLIAALPQLYAQIKLGQQRFRLAFDLSPDERRKFYYTYLLAGAQPAKELRLFGLGQYFLDSLLNLYQRTHSAERRQEQRALRWEMGLGFLSSSIAGVAFVLIVLAALAGRLTIGDIMLYVSAVASVQSAMTGVVMSVAELNESVLFHSYMQDLLLLSPDLSTQTTPRSVPVLSTAIELRNVSFRYNDQQPWILRDVNLTIPAGSCLALVGLNGAGKSTLVKLLTRLYDPVEGQILWDGVDIRQFQPAEFRQRVGAIFQDFMRYDLTVQENIGLGNLAKLDDVSWVQQSASQAHIHDDILELPQGYATELTLMFGEEQYGVDLSGGQWQRIATARMLSRNADLLILDEPTASLDAEAEYETYRQFAQLMEQRTSILISHRFSTVRMADVIAVLEGGRITEYGTHDALLLANRTYARLYRMQAESYQTEQGIANPG